MFAVKCPRCTKEWYSNEKAGGRVRLCSDCSDVLKRNRRDPLQIDAFIITTAVLVLVDLAFIGLSSLWPGTVGRVMWYYGALLGLGGFFTPEAYGYLKGFGRPFGLGQGP